MVSAKIFFYYEEFHIQQVANLNSLSNIRRKSFFRYAEKDLFLISNAPSKLFYSINLDCVKNSSIIIIQRNSTFSSCLYN